MRIVLSAMALQSVSKCNRKKLSLSDTQRKALTLTVLLIGLLSIVFSET